MKRNYGIDLLRMLSMFMVVMLHVLGQGGLLYAVEENSVKYWILWFLEMACFCAANCFALISGYVMYQSRVKISKALLLWLQVAFYTIGAAAAVFILKPEAVGLGTIADAICLFDPHCVSRSSGRSGIMARRSSHARSQNEST